MIGSFGTYSSGLIVSTLSVSRYGVWCIFSLDMWSRLVSSIECPIQLWTRTLWYDNLAICLFHISYWLIFNIKPCNLCLNDLMSSAVGNKCHTFIGKIYKTVCVKMVHILQDTRSFYDYAFKISFTFLRPWHMYLVSLAMEDKIPYLGITISSFVAIHPHWITLCYNIGELIHTQTLTYWVITVIPPMVARLIFIFVVAYNYMHLYDLRHVMDQFYILHATINDTFLNIK